MWTKVLEYVIPAQTVGNIKSALNTSLSIASYSMDAFGAFRLQIVSRHFDFYTVFWTVWNPSGLKLCIECADNNTDVWDHESDFVGLTHYGPTSRPSPASCFYPAEPGTSPQQRVQPEPRSAQNVQLALVHVASATQVQGHLKAKCVILLAFCSGAEL